MLHGWIRTANAPMPCMERIHPLVKPKNNWFMTAPVNINLASDSQVVPVDALHRLIDSTRYIHIMDRCVCRTGNDCQNHRHDIGCMFLGASGLEVARLREKRCHMHNISFDELGAMQFGERCCACGRCALNCLNGSARISTDDPEAFEKRLKDIEGLADLVGPGTGKKPLPY